MSNSTEPIFNTELQLSRHIRTLTAQALRIGRKSAADLFALGAILEEGAALLKGTFGAWVEHDCRIERRTAQNYRVAHRELSDRKQFLISHGVQPTVIIKLATSAPEIREHALELIESGRCLRIRDVVEITRASDTRCAGASETSRVANYIAALARTSVRRLLEDVERVLHETGREEDDAPDTKRISNAMASLAAFVGYGFDHPDSHPAVGVLSATADALRQEKITEAVTSWRELEAISRPLGRGVVSATARRTEAVSEQRKATAPGLTAIELCAGGGGQALGLERAGFHHLAMVEKNAHACKSLRQNFPDAPVFEQSLEHFDPGPYVGADLVAGGVPCQPFSMAGERLGPDDKRDQFPQALRIIDAIRPRAVMLENVGGLLDTRFDGYRREIISDLTRMKYRAEWRTVDCSMFGIAQKRMRSILIAFREGEGEIFSWPKPMANYKHAPWTAYAALCDLVRARGWEPPEEWGDQADRLAPTLIGGSQRKMSADLGQKNSRDAWERMGINPRRIADEPPPPDHQGDVTLTLKMCAALQGFPEDHRLLGPKQQIFKQIANAFPPNVALQLGWSIRAALLGQTKPERVPLVTRNTGFRPWTFKSRNPEASTIVMQHRPSGRLVLQGGNDDGAQWDEH